MTIAVILKPRMHDLGGGMQVRRLLPAAGRQGVGPFIFFDHFGPVGVRPQDNHDVRPHPHIGLATVTYMLEGAIMHRDSLGCMQKIEPGAINWMTSGRGIVHSERRPEELRDSTYTNHGLQLWSALPAPHEEAAPAFAHTPATAIPACDVGHAVVRVLIGNAFGLTSPVATFQRTLYLDVRAAPASNLRLEAGEKERAIYSVDEPLVVAGTRVEPHTLALLEPGADVGIAAPTGARYVVIGGEPVDGRRHMWWNFVSTRKERIEEAKRAWAEGRMGQVPGDTEFIPLPG